ncbi:hypothetical protein GM418_10865 [Maribellus comscasis]|uniref:Uncharacterized protein n=1 Tax=Maribellus comscasis TaxID=2681766 RepID=A0A6I6JNW6_9BACT|nr:hypothetical protein [Maribellus comscasis]QGY44141.1 hypothetical protein GM418_10865 [Maribellus comscasis]
MKNNPENTLDDRHEGLNLYKSSCPKCKYYTWGKYSCEAFPTGIPDLILSGEDLHYKPLDGQKNSLVFNPN